MGVVPIHIVLTQLINKVHRDNLSFIATFDSHPYNAPTGFSKIQIGPNRLSIQICPNRLQQNNAPTGFSKIQVCPNRLSIQICSNRLQQNSNMPQQALLNSNKQNSNMPQKAFKFKLAPTGFKLELNSQIPNQSQIQVLHNKHVYGHFTRKLRRILGTRIPSPIFVVKHRVLKSNLAVCKLDFILTTNNNTLLVQLHQCSDFADHLVEDLTVQLQLSASQPVINP